MTAGTALTLPTLVLLPGMDGTGELFDPLLAQLPTHWEVVVVRYPRTEIGSYATLEAIARQSLPPDRPFVLLGESFSGPIAISLAASQPKGLRGLVLCSTFARSPRPHLHPLKALVDWLPIASMPHTIIRYLLLGNQATPTLQRTLSTALHTVSDLVLRARLQAVMAVDVREKLRHIAVPTLYMQARQDRLVPRCVATEIQRFLPTMQCMALDTPHALLQTAPHAAAKALLAFALGLMTTGQNGSVE